MYLCVCCCLLIDVCNVWKKGVMLYDVPDTGMLCDAPIYIHILYKIDMVYVMIHVSCSPCSTLSLDILHTYKAPFTFYVLRPTNEPITNP